jgi:hypothetical protein
MTVENSSGRCRRCSKQNEAARSDGETMTALGATRAYHGATTPGAHAHQETVGALTAHNRWLVGAFHGYIP